MKDIIGYSDYKLIRSSEVNDFLNYNVGYILIGGPVNNPMYNIDCCGSKYYQALAKPIYNSTPNTGPK